MVSWINNLNTQSPAAISSFTSPSNMSTSKKLILIFGATGAQGVHIVDSLLAPQADGTPSPYALRAFTRDPSNPRAQELTAKGVECVKGIWVLRSILISILMTIYDRIF